jgi:hypothetical protein
LGLVFRNSQSHDTNETRGSNPQISLPTRYPPSFAGQNLTPKFNWYFLSIRKNRLLSTTSILKNNQKIYLSKFRGSFTRLLASMFKPLLHRQKPDISTGIKIIGSIA